MKIPVDTNVLVRAVLNDDPAQSRIARKLLQEASLIAVPLPCLLQDLQAFLSSPTQITKKG